MKKVELLKERFGHNAFRTFQEEAIDAILAHQDLIMILPTGGGKSLTYQLPALLLEGTAIVISPLIALMQDQVNALNMQQMQAAMIASNQSAIENEQVIQKLLRQELKFLYLSPERFNTPKMKSLLASATISFFVIDEAHCISEWGHEFREDYRLLSSIKEAFPGCSIAAFTATATSAVQKDIESLLALHHPAIIRGTIYRPNLKITVQQRLKKGYDALKSFLAERRDARGIIYMSSRAKCEELSLYLNQNGFSSNYYHAGMDIYERNKVFETFVRDQFNIMVATIAFGMGIDKSDIRFVVHMSMPKTLENYYQEIGRAGRDGEDADALMLFSGEDMVYAKMRLEEIENPSYRRNLTEKLAILYRYITTEECRHQFIARYFEDTIAPCKDSCDNCLSCGVEKKEITQEAQKFLSAIYRTKQRFGKTYVIQILRGASIQKIMDNEHHLLSVFGIGTSVSEKQWLVICDRLFEIEALTLGEYQTLHITPFGNEILRGHQKVDIAVDRLNIKDKTRKVKLPETIEYDGALFGALRLLRNEIAQDRNIPSYIVFQDKTLKEMARLKPTTQSQLLAINGVGQKKYEQFGEQFLEKIAEFL